MNLFVLGNIFSFLGCTLMVAIGLIRSKKAVLTTQCGQFILQGIGHFFLGAISGCVCCGVGIVRNLVITRVKHLTLWKLIFIAVQMGLTFLFDGFGLLVWLPILSAVIFTWFIDVKSPMQFKVVIVTTQVLWVVYDLCYRNYSALAFDIFTLLSNFVGMWMIHKAKAE